MAGNIADWIAHWDNFDKDLYIRYLIVKQNNESQEGKGKNLDR